ncbi:Vacuolar cation/proton exchanger 5 [Glycine max]|nr:Vacuolar cation/proton exchanger 5 [Glycine max]
METPVEVKPTRVASGFLDDLSETCKMGTPNGRAMCKSDDEVPFDSEINFHLSESILVDVRGSHSGESQTARHETLAGIIYKSIRVVVFSNKLNLLMPFGPLAILVQKLTGHLGWVFGLSLLGIVPLAERLVGGLLNATFGNATELIISIYALKSGMTRVVQLSLLGSILSNMLLVLGCAFLCGGIVNHKKEQVFNKAAASVNSGLLLMAVMGILFPAVLHYTHTEVRVGKSELSLSRLSSCIMLVAYVAYLFFQLKSQRSLYVSVNEGASMAWEIPVAFISVILLPLVGNAAEHASAIMFAMKDKLDISLGVAIGSSTQISMFVIPFCVVIGWIIGQPMDLNFQLFETAALFLTVIVVAFMLQEGTANYFKGLMLILCYLIVAASFYGYGTRKRENKNIATRDSDHKVNVPDDVDSLYRMESSYYSDELDSDNGQDGDIESYARKHVTFKKEEMHNFIKQSVLLSEYYLKHLTLYTGDTVGVGGNLNASFGNATELIISICTCALKTGKIRAVQLSLLGSIFFNMLLVLGCEFHKEQVFNKEGTANYFKGLMLILCYLIVAASFYVHVDSSQ